MNYTGNPRHLRGGLHSRSSQRVLRLRHTPAILERPWLDICRTFQKQTECRTARPSGGVAASSAVALSTTSSMEDGRDCFQTKRRRLLEQSDWLGLELAAPINVSKPSALSPPFDGVTKFVTKKKIYELRAAKEQKRRASGPFIRPLFSQPSNSSTESSLPRGTPSLPSRSPAPTSHSSASRRPQASIPSIRSAHTGSAAFVPSHYTTPVNTNPVTSLSKSTCSSGRSWNSFVKPSPPSISDLGFIPDTKADPEVFPRQLVENDAADMRNIWTMIEERKQEDNLLLKELGWESQSGVSASQMSGQQSQRVFCQSQHQVVGTENREATENAGVEELSAASVAVVSSNGIAEGGKTMTAGDARSKEVANITPQDDENDEVGLPWF